METKTLGRYIVADPTICHGEPTFRGTRIMIADMREQVESGMAWGAIVEVVRMAREVLVAYAPRLCESQDFVLRICINKIRGGEIE